MEGSRKSYSKRDFKGTIFSLSLFFSSSSHIVRWLNGPVHLYIRINTLSASEDMNCCCLEREIHIVTNCQVHLFETLPCQD